MQRLIGLLMAALCVAVPVIASAADGYVTGNVNMRAGPDYTYPLVVTLPPGTPVAVQGCTADWAWCDVVAYDNRGWIAGNFIQYDDEGQPVLLPSYATRIGIPIVTFVISTYWDAYYRNRPFYRERATWYRRPVPHRPPPRPIHNPPRPIHAVSSRPAPRPTASHAQPGRPPQYKQSGRPPQHAQSGRQSVNRRTDVRPAPHSSGAPKGKPAPRKKNGHQQH